MFYTLSYNPTLICCCRCCCCCVLCLWGCGDVTRVWDGEKRRTERACYRPPGRDVAGSVISSPFLFISPSLAPDPLPQFSHSSSLFASTSEIITSFSPSPTRSHCLNSDHHSIVKASCLCCLSSLLVHPHTLLWGCLPDAQLRPCHSLPSTVALGGSALYSIFKAPHSCTSSMFLASVFSSLPRLSAGISLRELCETC